MSINHKTSATEEVATPVLVPRIRFPEFEGSGKWTTVKLGAVAKIRAEKVGKNVCVPMSITSGVGLVSQEEKFGRVIAGDSYKNYLLLKTNEFAYNKSATKDYPEGFLTAYFGNNLAAVPNSIFTCFRINGDSLDVRFLNHQFSDNLHGRWLRKFIQVGARANGALSINDSDLMALPVPVPMGATSVAEQQKIADCLSSADELIAAQARKVDALKTHKKGLMQELFPREGKSQPRRRFPEFQNAKEWAEVALGDIAEIKLGKMLDKQKHTTGHLLPYLNNLAVRWNEVDTSDLPKMYFNDRELDRFGLRAGDVVVCEGGEPGRAAVWDGRLSELKFQKAIHRVRFKVPFEPKILVLHLENLAGTTAFEMLFTGGGIKHLTGENFSKLKVPLIPYAEQHRIVSCLSSLDTLITAEAQKLDALKTHKKGLMQQLFPSAEEAEA